MNVDGIVTARANTRAALLDQLVPGRIVLYAGWPAKLLAVADGTVTVQLVQGCDLDEFDGHGSRRVPSGYTTSYMLPASCEGRDAGLISLPAVRHLYGPHSDIPASGPGGHEYIWVQHADRDGALLGGRAYQVRCDDEGAYILCGCGDGSGPKLVPVAAIEYDPAVGPRP